MNEHKLFKINQDAVIRDGNGKVLVLKQGVSWKLPGGRLEENETPQEGLSREIYEETGIKKYNIEKILNPILSESKNTYRVTFLCNTTENSVILSDEHTEYAWIGLEDLDIHNFAFKGTKEMLRNSMFT